MLRERLPGVPLTRATLVLITGLALTLHAGMAEARSPLYDLESLAYLADDIIEGRLGESYKLEGLAITDVQVTSVHKGSLASGETVKLMDVSPYRKPSTDPELPPELSSLNPVPLAVGEHVIVFLAKADPITYALPANETIHVAVRSGVRVMVGGKVFGFWMRWSPGPYVLRREEDLDGDAPTRDAFMRELQDAIARTDYLKDRFALATTREHAPWLLGLLRQRVSVKSVGRTVNHDHIAQVTCHHLASLHDPEVLEEALQLESLPVGAAHMLGRGLGTPAGRDYLLAGIADPASPAERKLLLARAIWPAGRKYRSRLKPSSWTQEPAELGPRNDDYMTRIAQLLIVNREHEELCLELVSTIGRFAGSVAQMPSQESKKDLAGALEALRQVYRTSRAEALRYEIEVATAAGGRDDYEQLGSPCGPIPSIVTAAEPGRYEGLKGETLRFRYSYRFLDEGPYEATLVLRHEESGERYMVQGSLTRPRNRPEEMRPNESGTRHVIRPPGMPAGRYRVRLEFTENDNVVSVGHHCEADL